ncbi:fumarate hydratase [Fulvivirga imtechensis AK7]|uniref:Fumarate hydratase n=1 Tax=Fulvivirga imtechensis AK7 TaxID=1237149 RepID=L8JR35_9BACT|nr:hypothetical protein [Fulvivirga imtechensis]ELR69959.1 fumarate hydratase [Fulvivirga imtechensis AK7]
MTIIPHKRETLILPFSANEVISRLSRATQPASLTAPKISDSHIRFIGQISRNSFKISRKINYPQNYLPIITGDIEESSRGCIIFVKYKLFFSSLMFFMFWTIMTALIGAFFLIYPREYLYAALSFVSGAINYIVTVLNFHKQVKITREALDEVLKITS